ncbi:MAG: hypothetical protein AAF696_21585 [Bacteroidota bacterium]
MRRLNSYKKELSLLYSMRTNYKWLRICLWTGIFFSSASTAFHHYRLSQCDSITKAKVLEEKEALSSHLIDESRLYVYDTLISAGLLILFSLGLFLLYSYTKAKDIEENHNLIKKVEDFGRDR